MKKFILALLILPLSLFGENIQQDEFGDVTIRLEELAIRTAKANGYDVNFGYWYIDDEIEQAKKSDEPNVELEKLIRKWQSNTNFEYWQNDFDIEQAKKSL